MRNKSDDLVTTAVANSDPDTCVQALSAVMAVINSNNATDGSDEATERVQLRSYVLATHYPSCVAMMNLTTTTATQRATSSTTTAEPAELSLDGQREALEATKGLAVEADVAGEGIASDTASAIGNALSAVLDVARSVLGPSTASDARPTTTRTRRPRRGSGLAARPARAARRGRQRLVRRAQPVHRHCST